MNPETSAALTRADVEFNAFGVRLVPSFEDRACARIVRWVFQSHEGHDKLNGTVRIVSRRSGQPPERPTGTAWRILGSDIAVAPGEIWYRQGRHVVRAAYDQSSTTLEVQARFIPRVDRRLRSLVLPQGRTRWEDALHDVRGAVYLPLFWFLTKTRGVAVVHAAAVSWKGNGILIVGLNGSGKTTLAAKMRALGAHPIADNYGLVSADGVLIPFPELERTELVPADQKTLFCAFGKRFAQSVTIWPPPVPLSTILLLSRSDQFRISLLTPASTLEGLSVVHRLTPEFIEHSPLALLDAQPSWMDANVRPESDLATTWPERVVRSMREARAYSVSVTPEMLLETTRVQQLLDLTSATRVQ